MAISTALKAEALAQELGGQAKLAGLLGVQCGTVSRWLHGGALPANSCPRQKAPQPDDESSG
jgi:DNA-binding transcriptional regulator YdaS (Cro superfamily)